MSEPNTIQTIWSELSQENKPTIHVVVGTQILLELENLTKILELIDIDLERNYKVHIPWIVTEELNELKNNGSSVQKAAVQNVFEEIQHRIKSPRLILQNLQHDLTLRAAHFIAIRSNHDKIIAHCMQLKQNGHIVKLFAADPALQVRAYVMGGIGNFDCDEALEPPEPMLMDLAGEIVQEIVPPREAQLRQIIRRSWSLFDDQNDLPPLEPASEFIAQFEAAPDRKRRLLQKLAKTILDPNFQFEIE